MINNTGKKVPDVLAYPLDKAREILHHHGFHGEVCVYGKPEKQGRNVLRAARQKLNEKGNVEIVAVYALDEVIEEV